MDRAGMIQNERTKLLANAPTPPCTSCFTVGIATPIAGYVYNVSGFRNNIEFGALAFGLLGWTATALLLHLPARRVLGRAWPMNEYFILAYVVTPIFVVLLGWIAVLLHERSLRRERGES